jgi:hypothetical protein
MTNPQVLIDNNLNVLIINPEHCQIAEEFVFYHNLRNKQKSDSYIKLLNNMINWGYLDDIESSNQLDFDGPMELNENLKQDLISLKA